MVKFKFFLDEHLESSSLLSFVFPVAKSLIFGVLEEVLSFVSRLPMCLVRGRELLGLSSGFQAITICVLMRSSWLPASHLASANLCLEVGQADVVDRTK